MFFKLYLIVIVKLSMVPTDNRGFAIFFIKIFQLSLVVFIMWVVLNLCTRVSTDEVDKGRGFEPTTSEFEVESYKHLF